jgi:hypothetical protein
MNNSTIAIFEEYCEDVKRVSADSVEIAVKGKYFTELYARVMLHGWTCLSIMSDQQDNHIATFIKNGDPDAFDEMLGDEFRDDDNDWWKHQD